MKSKRNEFVSLILAVILSLILHFVAVAHIKVKGFGSSDAVSPALFVASIEREVSHRPRPARPIRDILRKDRETTTGETPSATDKETESVRQEWDIGTGADKGSSEHEMTVVEDKGDASPEALKTEAGEYPDKEETQLHKPGEKPDEPRSFTEKLNYDIYWFGVHVGNALIVAASHDGNVTITSEVESAPFISNFYRVEDYAESIIIDGLPVSFRIKQHEGKYRSNKETLFDIANKKITYVDYLKDLKAEHDMSLPVLWDVISGFYHLRAQHLDVGNTVFIDVFDSNKILSVEVDVLRKEKILLFDKRETDAVIVKPMLRSEGLFQKKGDIFIWLTDDEVRIPVRVETEVPLGKVVVVLNGMESEE